MKIYKKISVLIMNLRTIS